MEGRECNGPCHNVRFLLVQKARPARNIKRRERERKREREREREKERVRNTRERNTERARALRVFFIQGIYKNHKRKKKKRERERERERRSRRGGNVKKNRL